MKKIIPLLIGALLVATALYFLSCHCSNRFQAKLNHKMGDLITSSTAFSGASFALDGRDVVLTGKVDSEDIKSDLEAKAKDISGVRSVINELVVDKKLAIPTPVAPPVTLGTPTIRKINFVLDKTGNTIALAGLVANQTEMNAVLSAFQGYDVDNHLSIAELPEEWKGKALGVIDLSTKFEQFRFGITGDKIDFKGDMNANERADLIQLQLRKLFPNASITSDIAVTGLDSSARDCQSAIQAILDAHAIQFAIGSATIAPESIAVVEQVTSVGKQCTDIHYTIAGHTDNTGSIETNQPLSQARAQAVADLMSELGIISANIEAKGYGSSRPVADNNTELGRQLNRRIEIVIKQ